MGDDRVRALDEHPQFRRFRKGDRVKRLRNVHDQNSGLMTGEVVEVHMAASAWDNTYTVQWDDDNSRPHRGYYWWGLDHE